MRFRLHVLLTTFAQVENRIGGARMAHTVLLKTRVDDLYVSYFRRRIFRFWTFRISWRRDNCILSTQTEHSA